VLAWGFSCADSFLFGAGKVVFRARQNLYVVGSFEACQGEQGIWLSETSSLFPDNANILCVGRHRLAFDGRSKAFTRDSGVHAARSDAPGGPLQRHPLAPRLRRFAPRRSSQRFYSRRLGTWHEQGLGKACRLPNRRPA
jgi:hypothetical protein